jgi:hypothetical protein
MPLQAFSPLFYEFVHILKLFGILKKNFLINLFRPFERSLQMDHLSGFWLAADVLGSAGFRSR